MKVLYRLCFLLLVAGGPAFAAEQTLEDFLKTYVPQVEDQLRCIHDHEMTEQDRFLVVEMPDGYVQCLFHDNDQQIFCETSSGFWRNNNRIFSPEELQNIRAQGFDVTVTDGNFPLEIENSGPAFLRRLAERMLTTAYLGFGARLGDITTFGPFADVCRYIS